PEELTVRLDPERMRRVVDNVINNAREMSRAGDPVEVRWARGDRNDVVLEVLDHGPGIPAELRDRLFDPFVTAGKENGSGLGLAISRKIVEAHGAEISADNAPGAGARFVIRIPDTSPVPDNQPEGVPA
ncbi:MAG: ATP-binding protein, partial [Gemmatimonadetes bacterium]|nr:ATP-binding protein [Gemmatimonadota bacterium]